MSHLTRQDPQDAGQDIWTRSDEYHRKFLIKKDDALDASAKNNDDKGLPDIAVSPSQGKLLYLQARAIGARNILEVGTLGGYSTIWLARALPEDGKLITLELEPHHAKVGFPLSSPFRNALIAATQVAEENLSNAGLSEKVKVIVGPAAESIAKLEPNPPFDFIFIDADKPSNLIYFKHAKRLVRKGGVIIVDNVVRYGRVSDPEYTDEKVEGVRSLLDYLSADDEVEATTIATVDSKGYDGFTYILKL